MAETKKDKKGILKRLKPVAEGVVKFNKIYLRVCCGMTTKPIVY